MSTGKVIAIVLVICGALGVVLVAACGGMLYMGYQTATASVAPEIDRLFAAIENDTFADTYETDTTPEFRSALSKEQYADIGKAVATRLGRLKSKSLTGFNMRAVNADSFVDVSYNGTFEHGTGAITAKMKHHEGKWKLVSFHVNSPVFQQDVATEKCAKCGEAHPRNARFCPACGAVIPRGADKPPENDPVEPTKN